VKESFAKFEYEGWQRVARKYDSFWASSTRQFIPPLLDAAEVSGEMSVLDVGCGPGYVSAAAAARGATPRGLDFSNEMIGIAQTMFPKIEFQEGDAQNLQFVNGTFDRVLANFTLLHVPDPERACAEACRVLKPGGKFGFTVWAALEENPYAKMIDDAIREHADLQVDLPAGFNGESMIFKLHSIYWIVPTPRYPFDAERDAGVRTAGLLARQTRARLQAIQSAIEESVRRYAKVDGFAIPTAAYVIAVSKKGRMEKEEETMQKAAA